MDRLSGGERDVSVHARDKEGVVIFGGGFAPNGKWYAVAGDMNDPLRIIDIATGKEACICGKWCVAAQEFSADSKLLIASCAGQSEADNKPCLRLLSLPGGELVKRIPTATEFEALALSHNGKLLACASGGEIQLLELPGGNVRRRLSGAATKLRFTADDKTLAALSPGDLTLWDVESGKPQWEQRATITADHVLSCDGKRVASLQRFRTGNGVINVWDIDKLEVTSQFQLGENEPFAHLRFSVDGKFLFARNQNEPTMSSWDATGKARGKVNLVRHKDEAADRRGFPEIAPDGKWVVAIDGPGMKGLAESQRRLSVWNLPEGKLAGTHLIPGDWHQISWGPRGKVWLKSSMGDFMLIDPVSGALLRQIMVSSSTNELVTSHDGRLVAAKQEFRGQSPYLKIHETATGKELAALSVGMPEGYTDLLWLDEHSLLVFKDRDMQIWDIPKQSIRYRIPFTYESGSSQEKIRATSAHLFPDGRHLFTSMDNGTGLIWDLSPGLVGRRTGPDTVGKAEVKKLWNDLASDDIAEAYRAIWRLSESPPAMALLIGHLKESADAEYEKACKLITQLGDKDFRTREQAQQQIGLLGLSALQAIRDAQGRENSPEVKRRLEHLAARFPPTALPMRTVRRLRAFAVLEKVNSSETRQFLTDLAANTPTAVEKEEALATLERMKRTKEVNRAVDSPKK
jgi:WD40 repeat protein